MLGFYFKHIYQFRNILKKGAIIQSVGIFKRPNRTLNTTPKVLYEFQEDDQPVSRNFSKYTHRSHTCGELRSKHIGERVVLCGWLEYQRMNKFIVLRDGYGHIQLLVKENDVNIQKILQTIPFESILKVEGTVSSRPKHMVNKSQPTGEIEILIDKFEILNRCKENLPFNIREFQKAKEPLRMQYRYLDLRFIQMQRNLRFRSKVLMKMREFLVNNEFVDVETPTLFKATPGGAQEFIVPTRFPGQFYSLVQSPQQFKQILMAGAIDRYFQIARCYRDEGTRSDRQPEFTQLDIEMSFTTVDRVITLIEELLEYCLGSYLNAGSSQFQRIKYNEAMEKYGTDKPDATFDFTLKNCTNILQNNPSLNTNEEFGAYFLYFPSELVHFSKKVKELTQHISSKFTRARFVQTVIKSREEFINRVGKLLTNDVAATLIDKNHIPDNSVFFMAFGNKIEALSLLGSIRLEYVNHLENIGLNIRRKGLHFLWVVDFPLFELAEDSEDLQSAHHPFTAPHPDDLHLLKTDPLQVRAQAYDLVLNGNEVGGGSIRIHDQVLQKSVLELLRIKSDTMQHMLEMLESGCPPHGGIALGLDRLLSVLLGTTSIRDVIAFPKNSEGRDPLSGAPSYISDKDKKLYHIKTVNTEKTL